MKTTLILAAFISLLGGCKDVGDHCEVNGDGFSRADPCSKMCIEWEITCPGGQQVNPEQCSGGLCASDDDCESDQICLQIDSFADNSRCMMASVCE